MELSERSKSNEYEVLSAVEKLLIDSLTHTSVNADSLRTVCNAALHTVKALSMRDSNLN